MKNLLLFLAIIITIIFTVVIFVHRNWINERMNPSISIVNKEECINVGLIFEWTDKGPSLGESQLCGKEMYWTKAYGPNMEYTINLLQAENKSLINALEIIEGWSREEINKVLQEATANIKIK